MSSTATPALQPVEGGTLVQAAINAVTNHIRSHGLRVGDTLPGEGHFADTLGVSRAVMREACGALAALKLIDVGNGRKPRVGALDGSVIATSLHKPDDYTDADKRETFLVVQIENPKAVENSDAIAAVPGVEVLFLGPGDMSLRLGCSPAVSDPVMLEVQRKVAAACKKHDKAWGRPVGTMADAKTIIDLGAQIVVHGSEFGAIHAHFTQCAADFDALLGASAAGNKGLDGKTY